jgi:hypothetical protein
MKGISRFTYNLYIDGDDTWEGDDISNFNLIDGYIQNHDSSCIRVLKFHFESQTPEDEYYMRFHREEGDNYKVSFDGGPEDGISFNMSIMLYAAALNLLYSTGNLKNTFIPFIESPFSMS